MGTDGAEDAGPAGLSLTAQADELLDRYRTLIHEYEGLRDAFRNTGAMGSGEVTGLGPHITLLKGEAATTEDLRQKSLQYALRNRFSLRPRDAAGDDEKRLRNKLMSSNLSAHEAHWGAVKKCHGITSLSKWVSTLSRSLRREPDRARRRKDNVLVNAVVSDGAEWLRVVTTTQQRLLFEMAESGWDFGNESETEEAPGAPTPAPRRGVQRHAHRDPSEIVVGSDDDSDSGGDDISILRIAGGLVRAARCNPCDHNYARPRVHLLLTRIVEGECGDVDVLLRRVRRLGHRHNVQLIVDCANSAFHLAEAPAFPACLPRLLPKDPVHLTPTINVDTSVLVALASDISHGRVTAEPWQNKSHVLEIRNENDRPGVVLSTILSKLAGRQLVCTREAAASLAKLVNIIGTPTERTRAALLLPRDGTWDGEASTPISGLRELSIHPIPDDVRLPVRVLDEDWDMARIETAVRDGHLPPVALNVAPEMTKPTVSVFSYGWVSGNMTITANGSAKRQIARLIDKYGMAEDERGPNIWAMETCRSLNGKKKEK